MHANSIAKTAFSTGDCHYEFVKLPFGLRNAPAVFSKIMKAIFGNMPFVEIYIDDITIHSKTFDEHIGHIKEVLTKVREHNLKLNAKCDWARHEIKLLGHIITGNSVKMDPDKIKAIEQWTTPTKVNHIQQFLGICGYYRRFIKDFSNVAAALYNLLKKDVKWKWTTECDKAFKELKRKLVTYPIVRKPDFNREFTIYTDASGLAIGAVLAQSDETGEYAVYYASRLLKGAEIHYTITEKECLAIVWAIKYFKCTSTAQHSLWLLHCGY